MEQSHYKVKGWQQWEPRLLLLPALAFLSIAFVLPVIGMLTMSFRTSGGGIGLDNFFRLFSSEYNMQAAARSLRMAVVQTAFSLLFALPLAYVMTRAGRVVRSLLLIVVVLPLMTSVVVRTFGWVVLLGPMSFLMQLPGVQESVGGNQGLLGTEIGVNIAMIQVLLPFALLTVLGSVSSVQVQLEEAARSLGAGFWRTLLTVVLPLAVPGIVAAASLVFVLSVSSFITPRFIGGAQIPVFAQTIYVDATTNVDWPFAAAQAVLLLFGVMFVLGAAAVMTKRRA